ncbi:MAG TPA: hypothetical protein VI981_04920 [Candidatus Paceibacterota bacterium]
MFEKLHTNGREDSEELPAEFDFHQERFQKMADIHEQKWWVKAQKIIMKQILDRDAVELSAVDFAHEEALRDDVDFERKRDEEEYEASERNLKPVIEALIQKRNNPERKDIRTLLVIPGGGMRCAVGAGQALIGLNAVGMDKAFDNVFGISGGGQVAAFFAGGKERSARGASIFYEECTYGEFIKKTRISRIMNVDVVSNAMTSGEKELDQKAVRDSGIGLYLGVTRVDDEKCEIINAKTARPGIMDALKATMAVPLFYGKDIEVNETKYMDGAFDPLPIQRLIEKFEPTHILILANVPFNRVDSFELSPGEYLLAEFLPKVGSLGTMAKFASNKKQMRESLEFIQKQSGVNIGILWPPDTNLDTLTTDPYKIEASELEAARGVIKAFGGEQPRDLNLYHHENT